MGWEHPTVESEFSVGGVPHGWVYQIDGEEPESWLSPDIEADPELMLRYWAVPELDERGEQRTAEDSQRAMVPTVSGGEGQVTEACHPRSRSCGEVVGARTDVRSGRKI